MVVAVQGGGGGAGGNLFAVVWGVVVVTVVVVVLVVVTEEVVVALWLRQLTARHLAAEGLPELVRHGVVQDWVYRTGIQKTTP